ncbi:carbohydrate-binding module family 13 protein [Rhizophagus clarus]|uniref:Carbohydrate-binding module family 13 protein n=1 Tax=Rhizophagus clarus TaxID=94130 RepID=A0A8H3L6Z1_9GLOM|nr:carbohydrate-binding module family 13 protein [Rhizophagus clarus]
MIDYYWIIAKHSGKVLEVEGGSTNSAKIIQYFKKAEDNPSVGTQLWYFDGKFIVNKKSGLVLDVCGDKIQSGTNIIQFPSHAIPASNQEWDYDRENNTINLRYDRDFVIEVKDGSKDDWAHIILAKKNGSQNQQFTLQKWNDTSSSENVCKLITNVMDNIKFLPRLSQNLLEILNDDDEYYDVTIEVGNDPKVKIFRAHMVILSCRSPHLREILLVDKKKNDGNFPLIKLPDILPEIFEIILRYIYSGRLSLKECDTSDIIKLLVAAKELDLRELTTYIQSFLIENKVNWMEKNFNLIYRTSLKKIRNETFLSLQKFCNDLISNEPDKIFESSDFTSIPAEILISVIKEDSLQMSEIQIWDHVLKWGLAQNPELPSEVTNFSKDDFNTLKNSLQHCIPFIRFHNLTSKEFLDKVLPYKKVLPKELYKELLREFLDNNTKTSSKSKPRIFKEINSKDFDSKIITIQHIETISKWIQRLEIANELTTSFEFELLFRGSRDGFYSEKFHEICDNQSHTVTMVKVAGSNEILGGYNPTIWKSDNSYGFSPDSFIFSFKNINRNEIYTISRVTDKVHAIDNRYYYGPSFGNGDLIIFGLDIHTLSNYCRSSKNSYEKSIRETEGVFSIEECEVFRIILKF